MIVRVVLTRVRGVRRTPAEIRADAGLAGDLTLDYAPSTHFRRPIRQAHLKQPRGASSTPVDALTPLADPLVVQINGSTMMLVGLETQCDKIGVIAEHAQGWLIRF